MVRLAILVLLLAAAPATAQCRLALALGIDISSSVDAREDALQRIGVANALRDPEVRALILAQPEHPIALAVFEWSGATQQRVLLDWTLLNDATLATAARRIAASTRSADTLATAFGEALLFADTLFAGAPRCFFQTLDLSGDGIHNQGSWPEDVYGAGHLASVTVNGLAIFGARPQDPTLDIRIETFYREQVIKGPAAFLEIANGFNDFERTLTRKLVREISTQVVGSLP